MIEAVAWIVLALIHATPAFALFQPALLTRLYGVEQGTPLFLFMQHRAALFLAVVVICLWSIVDPGARRLAVVAVAISMVAFLAIYVKAGMPNALQSIALADAVGIPFLAFAAWRAFVASG